MTNQADVEYETRSVKTVRGMEARTRTKLESEGWEFVSQNVGTVRSELIFRRPAPKRPWLVWVILGGVLVVLFGVIIVMSILTSSGPAPEGTGSATPSPTTTASSSPSLTSTASPSAEPPAPEPEPPVEDTTVDALLDRLNSADMGGISVGDRFRFTGELVMSEMWFTGAAGEYTVLLKAQGGAQDLQVFVDEDLAADWTDGTQVELVVESSEATINGETTDGWLRVVSATVM